MQDDEALGRGGSVGGGGGEEEEAEEEGEEKEEEEEGEGEGEGEGETGTNENTPFPFHPPRCPDSAMPYWHEAMQLWQSNSGNYTQLYQ